MKNHRRLRRHRRRMILLLIVSLVAIGLVIREMVADFRSRPVDYKVQHIQPVNSFLCPGDQLRYQVVLQVRTTPVVLEITEAWCREGLAGICERASAVTYKVPVLTPRYVDTIAGRTMPDTAFFRPGDRLEFHHATTDGDTVTGYIVGPVVVRDNCPPAAGGAGE